MSRLVHLSESGLGCEVYLLIAYSFLSFDPYCPLPRKLSYTCCFFPLLCCSCSFALLQFSKTSLCPQNQCVLTLCSANSYLWLRTVKRVLPRLHAVVSRSSTAVCKERQAHLSLYFSHLLPVNIYNCLNGGIKPSVAISLFFHVSK